MASAYLELTHGTPLNGQYTAVDSLSPSFSDEELSNLHIKITNSELFQPMQVSALNLSDTATVVFDVRIEDVPKIQTACILSGLQIFSEGTNGTDRRILKASKSASIVVKSQALSNNIIDEDDLLKDEGDWAPDTTAKSKNIDDCGGREPCENCTCGRAAGAGTDNQNTPPPTTSNCGKCGMGDAFRCASCPFLGKPAFKPGQEYLVLDLQDDL